MINNILKILSAILVISIFALVLEISSLGEISFIIQDKNTNFDELKVENELLYISYSDYILNNEDLFYVKENLNLVPAGELVYLDTYGISEKLRFSEKIPIMLQQNFY